MSDSIWHDPKLQAVASASDGASFAELLELSGLDPAKDMRGADWSRVNFGSIDLAGFDFSDANLIGADLSDAYNTEQAVFVGAAIRGARLPPGPHGVRVVARGEYDELRTTLFERLGNDLDLAWVGASSVSEVVDALLQEPPTEAIEAWIRMASDIVRQSVGAWSLCEDVFAQIVPRLVDEPATGTTWMRLNAKYRADSPLAELAVVRLEPWRTANTLSPENNVSVEELGSVSPNVGSAVDALGVHLCARYEIQVGERMEASDWVRLESRLRAQRHARVDNFYLVVSGDDELFTSPVARAMLAQQLPSLPTIVMQRDDADTGMYQFDGAPEYIEALIQSFWSLRPRPTASEPYAVR